MNMGDIIIQSVHWVSLTLHDLLLIPSRHSMKLSCPACLSRHAPRGKMLCSLSLHLPPIWKETVLSRFRQFSSCLLLSLQYLTEPMKTGLVPGPVREDPALSMLRSCSPSSPYSQNASFCQVNLLVVTQRCSSFC